MEKRKRNCKYLMNFQVDDVQEREPKNSVGLTYTSLAIQCSNECIFFVGRHEIFYYPKQNSTINNQNIFGCDILMI